MKLTIAVLVLTVSVVAAGKPFTWQPGNLDHEVDDGFGRKLTLSAGLSAKAIAVRGDAPGADMFPEVLAGKGYLHKDNDGGGVFEKEDGLGYYYVSNSEEKPGGVWVLETSALHDVVDYYQVLDGTKDNCAGGKTPWGTWVSCEEEHPIGYCYQVDPVKDGITSEVTYVTAYGSNWEGFAFGVETGIPRGYSTDDAVPNSSASVCGNRVCLDGVTEKGIGYCGALDRYTPSDEYIEEFYKFPNKATKEEAWNLLNDPNGKHEFLKLIPDEDPTSKWSGSFEWVEDPCDANPELYEKGEGIHIDSQNKILTFVGKTYKQIFYLDLSAGKYIEDTTTRGEICQQPDNIRGLGGDTYVCTDGHYPNSVFRISPSTGCYAKVLEEQREGSGYAGKEFAGVDFTSDGRFMYVSVQNRAIWVVWRDDGLPFDGKTLEPECEDEEVDETFCA